METDTIVNLGVFALMGSLFSLVSWLTKDKIKQTQKKIEDIEDSLLKGNKQFGNTSGKLERLETVYWGLQKDLIDLSVLPKQCDERTESHEKEHKRLDLLIEKIEGHHEETLERLGSIESTVSTFKGLLASCVQIGNPKE